MKWLKDLLKSRAEKEKDRILHQEHEAHEMLDEQLSSIVIFPGSLSQYESFVGHNVGVIDTGDKNKGIIVASGKDGVGKYTPYYVESPNRTPGQDIVLKRHLVEQGVEAIVGANYTLGGNSRYWCRSFYGLPVAKK